MARGALRRAAGRLAVAVVLAWSSGAAPSRAQNAVDIVATGVPRPLAIALDGRSLVVLSPGMRGDSAGELYRVDLASPRPVDLSRQPRVRIPFMDHPTTLGSLAINPVTHELFLGEENGTAIYRLTAQEQLSVYATGLRRLGGGGTLTFDGRGRLVIVDHIDPLISKSEEHTPPGLESFRDEDYRGPLVFRLTHDPAVSLPRHLDVLAPLFPRGWGRSAGGAGLPRLISVAALGLDDLVFLTSSGEIYRLAADGTFGVFTRLPHGQYNRTHMVAAPDGAVIVSGGFHVGQIFRITRDGTVSVVASGLADPEGIAVDRRGDVYVAESSLHRIVRLPGM